MITEDYVSFETAKLLKEKGFDGECDLFGRTDEPELIIREAAKIAYNQGIDDECVIIPTHQMAMKWLREVHNYDISICLDSYVEPYDNEYYIVIRRRKDRFEEISPCEQTYFKTYEKACEEAIKYCLENLI